MTDSRMSIASGPHNGYKAIHGPLVDDKSSIFKQEEVTYISLLAVCSV